jgi:hypothetical protein|tara:strand:+ start:4850 stop:5854 length:1005 start_codon:yes stop_codon:yes gene_type:complete
MEKLSVACLFAFSTVLPLSSLAADDYKAARTEWGQPNLQGVWNFSSNRPMQRPANFGEREFLTADEVEEIQRRRAAQDASSDAALDIEGVDGSYNDFWIENAGIGGDVRTSHIVYPSNGRLPSLVEGAIAGQGVYGGDTTGESRPVRIAAGGIGTDGPEDRGLSERCIIGFNAGPPMIPSLYNNNLQIIQHQDTVVLVTEMIHDARMVPLSPRGNAPLDDDVRLWTGDSRGYWDGETLVVETRNFNGLSSSFGAAGTSYDKVLTERFTRHGPITVEYEFTVDDPSTFTDKFTAIVPMTKVAGQLYEYACHEGNYGMVNILRGARVQENLPASER